ncbi:MAG: hypothetical protein JG767_1770 [Deferribacteraceae bacterium]|nr:hypothetical protein [Deferribacteraceae bacterium]
MKKILTLIYFLLLFVLSLIIFFPYQTVLSYVIDNYARQVTYSEILGNFNKSTIRNINIYGYKIGDMTIKHSLANLIMQKIDFYGEISGIKLLGSATKNKITFSAEGDASKLNSFLDKGYVVNSGSLNVDGVFNIKDLNLTGQLKLKDLSASAMNKNFSAENYVLKFELKNNNLQIETVESKSNPPFVVKGSILLNINNLLFSRLNLIAEIGKDNLKLKPRITGTISKPNVRF